MLSARGARSAASQDIPWRFAPGGNNPYDAETNPDGVISFATAENSLMHQELHDYVENNVTIPKAAYTYRYSALGGTRFPAALASHLNHFFRPHRPVEPEHIITAAGLTPLHSLLGHSLGDGAGDGILVARPVYGRFELDFGNVAGLRMVYADMAGIADPFCWEESGVAEEVVRRYGEARERAAREDGVTVRAVLVVNPNNPIGRTYHPTLLRALMSFCQSHNLHLISDEVYALSVYPVDRPSSSPSSNPSFTSILSIDPNPIMPDDDKLLHVLYGLSKDFAAAGVRVGNLVTRNADLKKSVAANMRFHSPSGWSVAVGAAMLEDRAWVEGFVGTSRERLREARGFVEGVLRGEGVEFWEGNAGFFVYMDLSPWLDDEPNSDDDGLLANREFRLAKKLLDAGIGLHPREEHADQEGMFRLVFSQERMVLELGLRRLISTLRQIGRS